MTLEAGVRFPAFTGKTQDGETLNLADYQAGKKLVVFFYPAATTRGCVRETTEFAERRAEFDAVDTLIVGVSVDEVAKQKEHAIQCAANFPVLSDEDKALTEQLGILNERGRAKRTTYILDGDGVVRQVFNDVQVDGHVDQVLAAVKQL